MIELIHIRLIFGDRSLFKEIYYPTKDIPDWFVDRLLNGKEDYYENIINKDGVFIRISPIKNLSEIKEEYKIIKIRSYIIS